jgi:hypothetical protein
MTDTPLLNGLTCWSVGCRDPDQITAERPGGYSVEILFNDPATVQVWCRWLMANDPAWRDA